MDILAMYNQSPNKDEFCRGLNDTELEWLGNAMVKGSGAYPDSYLQQRELERGVLNLGHLDNVQGFAMVYGSIANTKLTNSIDRRMLKYLSLGWNLTDIAVFDGISVAAVSKRVLRLRKRLDNNLDAQVLAVLREVFGQRSLMLAGLHLAG